MSSRAELGERIAESMRDLIADAVLTNERIARGFGIHVVDFQTYGLILRAGRPMTPTEVATMTGLPTSTVTRVLNRLEAAGFILRSADPADRRSVLVTVVPGAIDAKMQGANPYAGILEQLERHHATFTVAELETVARYLDGMISR